MLRGSSKRLSASLPDINRLTKNPLSPVPLMTTRRRFAKLALMAPGAALPLSAARGAGERSIEILSYPAPYWRADGSIMLNPVAMDEGSFTSAFPIIDEVSALVIMPYWSLLNPAPGEFDFSMIERALAYWAPRGRKLVIGPVCFGYPILSVTGELIDATPDWVNARSGSFHQSVMVIGPVRPLAPGEATIRLPLYWDPEYQAAQAALIHNLGRFDSHPGISKIRICTGIMGEDNPTFDGLIDSMPGFTNAAWIAYSRHVVGTYQHTFRTTTLEFDVDRLGFIKALGSRAEQAQADSFMQDLERTGVFLAMDGFDPTDAHAWCDGQSNGQGSGPARSIDYLAADVRAGRAVGLENGGIDQLDDADMLFLGQQFRMIGAKRLVLFPDAVAALNWARFGPNAQNASSEAVFGTARMATMARKASLLLSSIDAA